ncbi:MAG: VOC family protein [bacterium]
MKLHHVALGANDVETVAGFYCDLFDLAELRRHTYATANFVRFGSISAQVC